MKIYEFSPFNNETDLCDIKLAENSGWVDETHVIEFNKTFQNRSKEFNLRPEAKGYVPHLVDSERFFVKDKLSDKIKRKIRYWIGIGVVNLSENYITGDTWLNEAAQRNYSQKIIDTLDIHDDDVLIFSDIDEIIYSDEKTKILDYVNRYGIITVKLIFTTYFMNLKVKNWGGPPDYSYRVFIMTGKRYRSLKISIDMLRKAGERNKLLGLIYCPDEILGVHHSWLGDESFIEKKLKAYAHKEHKRYASKEFLRDKIKKGESFLPGVELEIINSPKYLSVVEKNISKFSKYII